MVIFSPTADPPSVSERRADHAKCRQSRRQRRVFCFGIGTDVNAHLLDKITEETRASSAYVTPQEDIEVKISSFYTKIKEPVLANPKLEFSDGIRVTKLYPILYPISFAARSSCLWAGTKARATAT